jgi:hypothetical protein
VVFPSPSHRDTPCTRHSFSSSGRNPIRARPESTPYKCRQTQRPQNQATVFEPESWRTLGFIHRLQ